MTNEHPSAAVAPRTATSPPLTFDRAPDWLRTAQACALAGDVSARTLRRWIVAGKIHAVKPTGGMVLISRDSLRAFLEGAPAASYYGHHYVGLAGGTQPRRRQ